MNKVYEYNNNSLYFTNADEYDRVVKDCPGFSALLCAKNPYHKEIVGYDRNCPKDHPEYLVAYRPKEHIMALNMVDAPKPEFFSDKMVLAGIDFIQNELAQNNDVVVVCNQGESRSPTMCLMYMMAHGDFSKTLSHSEVFTQFSRIAKEWNPNNGILQYAIQFWNKVKEGVI